jgi:hypothetical protein
MMSPSSSRREPCRRERKKPKKTVRHEKARLSASALLLAMMSLSSI